MNQPPQNSSPKPARNSNSSVNGFQRERPIRSVHESSLDMLSYSNQDIAVAEEVSTPQPLGFPFREQLPAKSKFLVPRLSSLRTKATLIALAIGITPVALVGVTAYFTAGQAIQREIFQNEKTNAADLEDKLNIFVQQRYEDTIALSQLDIFANPKLRNELSSAEKDNTLADYLKTFQAYNNLLVYDLEGNVLANSGGEINAAVLLDVDYTKAIQETNKPVIVDPRPNRGNGEFSFFVAAPIRDEATGKTTAIFRTRVPMPRINNIFGVDPKRGQAFYLTDSQGNITASSDPSVLQKKLEAVFPNVAAQIQQSKNQSLTTIATENGKEQIFTYVPNSEIARKYGLSWSLVLARPKEIALAPQYQLLTTLLIGTAIVALMVAILAIIIANRATRPILDAADAVERIGQGDLETRLNIKGEDELALLGENINSMAGQIATLLDEQARAAEEQRRQKEELQERALELLEEVDPINEGDLTVRARVTEDDIGTIADSYNVTVNNLRDIVAKVQVAATNVSETTQMNEMSIKVLSREALQQAERIAAALEQVKQMAESVRMVATNAEKAAMIAQQANQMVEEGEAAMDRTVGGINTIRETVAETRQKVKYLGESSQKITAVVNLISSFAAQTKLLAFNASIEANRAGQEGRGFAVVAEEVRSLAQQSAEASTEIEKLVAMIQGETNEVIEAMEAGTEQVVIGTKLVEETRQSLNKITAASTEINELVSAISRSTIQQASTSEAVTQTMAEVAESANKTAREADQVVSSFEELQKVAEELQQDTGRFKVS